MMTKKKMENKLKSTQFQTNKTQMKYISMFVNSQINFYNDVQCQTHNYNLN